MAPLLRQGSGIIGGGDRRWPEEPAEETHGCLPFQSDGKRGGECAATCLHPDSRPLEYVGIDCPLQKGRGPASAGPRLTTCRCRLRLAAELPLAAFGLAEACLALLGLEL